MRELVARVHALLRSERSAPTGSIELVLGDVRVDLAERRVRRGGDLIRTVHGVGYALEVPR